MCSPMHQHIALATHSSFCAVRHPVYEASLTVSQHITGASILYTNFLSIILRHEQVAELGLAKIWVECQHSAQRGR